MADPFDALRAPAVPVDPDPTFAARLRARLLRAFDLPKGVTVANLTLEQTMGSPTNPATTTSSVTPYLAVSGAREAIDWYVGALDAQLREEPILMADGRIGHAELEVAGGRIMLSEEHPEIGVSAPVPGQGLPVSIHLTVADVDAMISRAVAGGARLERPAADYEYGRNGVIRDPFGHRWLISNEPVTGGLRPGDIGYVSLWVPDVDRAATFFSAVLGWQLAPSARPGSRQVEGLNLHHGMWGGEPRSTLFLCFAVRDVDAAVGRIRQAGGTASEPAEAPYGRVSEGVDDQGVRFAVFEPPGGMTTAQSPARPGPRQGDLAYVTMEVVDSARTRAFYSSVLDWRFAAGRIQDGWEVENTTPMTGLHGGHSVATTVPFYRVDDIHAAVARVRAAGGAATEPEVQPYGVTSECTDDQGTRFYLGSL
jgi:predicted enzyme related to lactoylglutathione lyase